MNHFPSLPVKQLVTEDKAAKDADGADGAYPQSYSADERTTDAHANRSSLVLGHDRGLLSHLPKPSDLPGLAPAAVTKSRPAEYANEQNDAAPFRGGDRAGIDKQWSKWANQRGTRFTEVSTHYFGSEDQDAHQVRVKDQKLNDAGGVPLDTSAATGVGTVYREGQGKHIFALTPDHKLRTADPWGEHRERPIPGAPGETHLDMINHTSLVGGQDVKAAGELAVDHGKLTQVTDQSGHYHPTNEMLHQALVHLGASGADLHDVAVKMVGKGRGIPHLHASAREFRSVEAAMRQANAGATAKGESPQYNLTGTTGPGINPVEKFMRDRRGELAGQLGSALSARKRRVLEGNMRGEATDQQKEDAVAWAGSTEGHVVKPAAEGEKQGPAQPPGFWHDLGPLPPRAAPPSRINWLAPAAPAAGPKGNAYTNPTDYAEKGAEASLATEEKPPEGSKRAEYTDPMEDTEEVPVLSRPTEAKRARYATDFSAALVGSAAPGYADDLPYSKDYAALTGGGAKTSAYASDVDLRGAKPFDGMY